MVMLTRLVATVCVCLAIPASTRPRTDTTSLPAGADEAPGIYRHDVGGELFRSFGALPAFEAVGRVTVGGASGGGAVLVAPSWVLLSRHQLEDGDSIVAPESVKVDFGGRLRHGSEIVLPPTAPPGSETGGTGPVAEEPDLALMRLNRPVEAVAPATLTAGTPSVGTEIAIVGYGRFQSALGLYGPAPTGDRHAGTNILDQVGGDIGDRAYPAHALIIDLDHPHRAELNVTGSAVATNLEMVGNGGDSGGAWFVSDGRTGWLLAGISKGHVLDINRLVQPGVGFYGTVGWATGLAPFADWIRRHLEGA